MKEQELEAIVEHQAEIESLWAGPTTIQAAMPKPKMCIYCKQNTEPMIEKLWDWLCPKCGRCFMKGPYKALAEIEEARRG